MASKDTKQILKEKFLKRAKSVVVWRALQFIYFSYSWPMDVSHRVGSLPEDEEPAFGRFIKMSISKIGIISSRFN